VKLTIVL